MRQWGFCGVELGVWNNTASIPARSINLAASSIAIALPSAFGLAS